MSWRHTVSLGEHDIKADPDNTQSEKLLDQIGDNGSRPRPLTKLCEALFIDVYDYDWSRLRLSWMKLEIEVENIETTDLYQRGIPQAEQTHSQKQTQCHNAPNAETMSQTLKDSRLISGRSTFAEWEHSISP